MLLVTDALFGVVDGNYIYYDNNNHSSTSVFIIIKNLTLEENDCSFNLSLPTDNRQVIAIYMLRQFFRPQSINERATSIEETLEHGNEAARHLCTRHCQRRQKPRPGHSPHVTSARQK